MNAAASIRTALLLLTMSCVSAEQPARPLWVRDGRLLAQRESGPGLPLAIFDAATGRVLETFEAPLPEGVRAAVGAATGPFVWSQIGTGLPNAPVWDMDWDVADGKLLVGTLGRGAWPLQEDGACGAIPDMKIVRNQWISGTQVDSACTRITAGPALDVESSGDLTLKSPLIELVNGVAVKSGGELTTSHTVP